MYGEKLERQQFPLKLAWSITIHKAQGLTLNDVWVDLGPSEKAAGLTYVALTRVRTISPILLLNLCHMKDWGPLRKLPTTNTES